MTKPLVSVIIPLQNNEQFISHSLKSVCDQTYPNIEIIVVDNGSTDKSAEIVESFIKNGERKHAIHLLRHDTKGIYDALNKGLERASGEYLTFLNPEDYYHAERIEKLTQKAQQFDIHFIFTRVTGVDVHHQTVMFEHPWMLWYQNEMFNIIHAQTIEHKFLTENIAVCSGNLFFSRKLFETTGHFKNFKTNYCQDFILRAMQNFEMNFINEELYYFRLYESHSKREGLHSDPEELNQIRLDYFIQISAKQPVNLNAPSYTNWSESLHLVRRRINLNQLLGRFVQKSDHKDSKSTELISFKHDSVIGSKKTCKNITLVTQDLALGGGAPKLLLDLAQRLRTEGYRPKVFSIADGPLRSEFNNLGIPVRIVPKKLLRWTKKQGKIKRAFVLFRMVLFSYLNTSRHIIINSAASWPFALPFALFSPFKKITWYIHESYSPVVYLNTGLAKTLLRKAIEKNTFSFWFGSESTKAIWKTAVGVLGKVMYWSGLKKADLAKSKQERVIKNLLAIGTSHPRKGTHYLVNAFISCVKNQQIDEDVNLTIVGIPYPLDNFNGELILKIAANNLQNRIKLIPCVAAKEIDAYYKKADLFIQASILECLPLSLLQAMSEGIPIISTDVNGCKEAIQHNVTGYLCRPFSSLAIAETISEAVKNPEKAWEMGQNAQKAFNEKFSLDITMDEIVKELVLYK